MKNITFLSCRILNCTLIMRLKSCTTHFCKAVFSLDIIAVQMYKNLILKVLIRAITEDLAFYVNHLLGKTVIRII